MPRPHECYEQRQKDFNTVWQHAIVARNPMSMTGKSTCMYRGPNGAMCFYSVVLTEEERGNAQEGAKAGNVMRDLDIKRHRNDGLFYMALQDCHDNAAINEHMVDFHTGAEAYLLDLAHEYELTIPE